MRAPMIVLVCTALVGLSSAQAQNMKAGLWEIKQQPQLDAKLQAQMEQAQKAMASMPAEQRKMMEQMMAKQGVNINMSNGGIIIKACISEEQAKRNAPPVSDKGNCTHDTQRSGSVIRTHFKCTDPASEGDSEVTVLGNGDGFTSKTRLTHQRNGRPETISVDGEARWQGSNCGDLKPAGTGAGGSK